MNNFTPRQTDLLTHALAQGGQLFPLPTHLGRLALAKRSITPLLRRKLLVEVVVGEAVSAWRTSDDVHYGLQLTSLGRSLVVPAEVECAAVALPSKIARVSALLARAEGATLDEIIAATGWQPHSIRAALTGLRKTGMVILLGPRGEQRCYRAMAQA